MQPTLRWSLQQTNSRHYRPKNKTTTRSPNQYWKMEDFLDDSMDQSPAVNPKQPIQTTFKRPVETISDMEEPSTLITLTREQKNTAIHICRESHKYRFRDVDKLQHISTDKKRRIISKLCILN